MKILTIENTSIYLHCRPFCSEESENNMSHKKTKVSWRRLIGTTASRTPTSNPIKYLKTEVSQPKNFIHPRCIFKTNEKSRSGTFNYRNCRWKSFGGNNFSEIFGNSPEKISAGKNTAEKISARIFAEIF